MAQPDAIIGVDPGKGGAIAVIYHGNIPVVIPMPVAGKELDVKRIAEWLDGCIDGMKHPIAIVEKVHAISRRNKVTGEAMPQGVVSMFTFGFVTGVIHGVITSLDIPLYLVAPQTWKKVVLADTRKDKDAAIEFCRRVYSNISLLPTERSRKPNSGMADALCIAHYGYERFKDVV